MQEVYKKVIFPGDFNSNENEKKTIDARQRTLFLGMARRTRSGYYERWKGPYFHSRRSSIVY